MRGCTQVYSFNKGRKHFPEIVSAESQQPETKTNLRIHSALSYVAFMENDVFIGFHQVFYNSLCSWQNTTPTALKCQRRQWPQNRYPDHWSLSEWYALEEASSNQVCFLPLGINPAISVSIGRFYWSVLWKKDSVSKPSIQLSIHCLSFIYCYSKFMGTAEKGGKWKRMHWLQNCLCQGRYWFAYSLSC